jgi:hypothetical protein
MRYLVINMVLWIVVVASIGFSLALEARQQRKALDPFETVVKQSDPPVVLFKHRMTGSCYLAYDHGGLLVVPRTLCETLPNFPPIVDRPVSPEK